MPCERSCANFNERPQPILNTTALIAKICAHSRDRLDAIRKMSVALEEMYIEGIDTNAELHDRIFKETNFQEGNISINYLKEVLNIS